MQRYDGTKLNSIPTDGICLTAPKEVRNCLFQQRMGVNTPTINALGLLKWLEISRTNGAVENFERHDCEPAGHKTGPEMARNTQKLILCENSHKRKMKKTSGMYCSESSEVTPLSRRMR